MREYKYLIFDIDDTLLDFYSAFTSAQEKVATFLEIECSDEFKIIDEKCGWRAWEESGLENTDTKDVQNNYHRYYYEYLQLHYKYLTEELGIIFDTDEIVQCYLNAIASSSVLNEQCTLAIYKELATDYSMVLATNGVVQTQKKRVSNFLPYTHKVYISEEMGVIKPTKEYFDYILRDLNCSPEQCLMIGDSIMNDIVGAKKSGMDVCFYNSKHKNVPDNIICDFEIYSLAELKGILQK